MHLLTEFNKGKHALYQAMELNCWLHKPLIRMEGSEGERKHFHIQSFTFSYEKITLKKAPPPPIQKQL